MDKGNPPNPYQYKNLISIKKLDQWVSVGNYFKMTLDLLLKRIKDMAERGDVKGVIEICDKHEVKRKKERDRFRGRKDGISIDMRRLVELRARRRMSQLELSNKLNISVTTVSNWETGRSKVSRRQVERLEVFFGAPIGFL